LFQPSVISSLL